MWYWIKFLVLFLLACFFLLPAMKVEDPFRSIALRFLSKESSAELYNHQCNPDRIYNYRYTIDAKTYEQVYEGYIAALDEIIPESERCKSAVPSLPKFAVRYFPLFSFWSEPMMAERPHFILFLGINLVKIFSILLLIWTFLRK